MQTLEGASLAVSKPQGDILLVSLSNTTEDSLQTLREDVVAGTLLILHHTA